MVLNAKEESLINVVRGLPPNEAEKILEWARQLADLAGGRPIGWSDTWTDEDLTDARLASLHRFEDEEQDRDVYPVSTGSSSSLAFDAVLPSSLSLEPALHTLPQPMREEIDPVDARWFRSKRPPRLVQKCILNA